MHGHDLRYVADRKQWLIWDGSKWKPNCNLLIRERAKETLLACIEAAFRITDRDQSGRYLSFQWICLSQSNPIHDRTIRKCGRHQDPF